MDEKRLLPSPVFHVLPMDGILQGPLQHSSRSRSDDGALGVLDPWQQDSQLPTFLTPHQVAADTLFQLLCCIAGMSPKWSKDSTVSSKYGFQGDLLAGRGHGDSLPDDVTHSTRHKVPHRSIQAHRKMERASDRRSVRQIAPSRDVGASLPVLVTSPPGELQPLLRQLPYGAVCLVERYLCHSS